MEGKEKLVERLLDGAEIEHKRRTENSCNYSKKH